MNRDIYKDRNYYDTFIDYQNTRIAKFSSELEELINSKGENFEGVKKGYYYLASFEKNKLIALYSAGASLDCINESYHRIVNLYAKLDNFTYDELLDIASITIMLNSNEEEKKIVTDMIDKSGFNDILLTLLKSYIRGSKVNLKNKEFAFKDIYGSLISVINTNNNTNRENELKNYLTDTWYKAHKGSSWYETHKLVKDKIYYGYWSLESGALAKIYNINDEILKNIPYYPYDLVNYKR